MSTLSATEPAETAERIRLAAAYLSRVAEPACLPVWRFVRRHGYLDAADAIRRGDAPADVRGATEARRKSADPELDLDAAERLGIRLVTPVDCDWPRFAVVALENAAQRLPAGGRSSERKRPDPIPPLALWVRGHASLASIGLRSLSVVGARSATSYGTHVASELCFGLAERGVTVVSGGAFGIDAAAHRGALAAEGSTVLVSAAGLDRPYPSANKALFDAVAETGLLVSELPPGSAPHRQRFLSRNRLIAAFGTATVLVEAAFRSGALNTAGYCRDLERPLLAVPGPVTSALSVGCHREMQRDEGAARVVTSVADLMPWVGTFDAGRPDEPDLFDGIRDALRPLERAVLEGVPSYGAVTPDELSRLSNQPLSVVVSAIPALVSVELVTVIDGLIGLGPRNEGRIPPPSTGVAI